MDAMFLKLPQIAAGIVAILLLASLGLDYVRAGKLAPFLAWFRREKASDGDQTLPQELDRMATLLDLEKVRQRAIAANHMALRKEVDEAAKTLYDGEPRE